MKTKTIIIVLAVAAIAYTLYTLLQAKQAATGVRQAPTVITPGTPTVGSSNPVAAAFGGIVSLFRSPSPTLPQTITPAQQQEITDAYVTPGIYGPVQPNSPSVISVDNTDPFSTSSDVSSGSDLPSYIGADNASDGPFFS